MLHNSIAPRQSAGDALDFYEIECTTDDNVYSGRITPPTSNLHKFHKVRGMKVAGKAEGRQAQRMSWRGAQRRGDQGDTEEFTNQVRAIFTVYLFFYNLYDRALQFRQDSTVEAATWEEFKARVEKGFVIAHWDGTAETEALIKEETKATIRVMPTDEDYRQQYNMDEPGTCIRSGNPATQKVLFAKAY
jgi:hypothetical protein